MPTLDELFQANPAELSDSDLDEMVEQLRARREIYLQEVKAGATSAKADSKAAAKAVNLSDLFNQSFG